MSLLWDALYEEEEKTPAVLTAVAIEEGPEMPTGKPGPVVNKRKREGIQLCKVFAPAKPPKWCRVYSEPKCDGYRCVGLVQNGKAELLTSTGLPHWNVTHIKMQLETAATARPTWCDNVMLDGELVHDSLPFDIAGGLLRKHEPDPRATGFVFHVWDAMTATDFLAKQCEDALDVRKTRLLMTITDLATCGNRIAQVEYQVGTIDQIETFARRYVLEDGMEGIVVKDAAGLYQFRKSCVWLKWKPKFDADTTRDMKEGDFRVTGGTSGRGKHQGRLGAIFIEGYVLDDGNIAPDPPDDGPVVKVTGKAGTGFNDAQREQFQVWNDEETLAGRVVEVRYQEISPEHSLRFPVFARLREDKE